MPASLIALLLAGTAIGGLSLVFARSDPGYAFAGDSLARSLTEFATGFALIAIGVAYAAMRPSGGLGVLLSTAGIAWFLIEWGNPGTGSSFVFTVGLVLSLACAPFVAHAALAYPRGRLSSRLERVGLAVAYMSAIGVLGFGPALVFDPHAQGCGECPRNLLLVSDDAVLYDGLNRIGVRAGLVSTVFLILFICWRLFRSTRPRRWVIAPVALSGVAYLSLVAAEFVHSLGRGYTSNDPVDVHLWIGQAAALLALSLSVAWSWVRAHRTRSVLTRLVLELGQAPAPGALRHMLMRSLNDPSLELGYPLADGRIVDARGQPLALAGEATPLVRGGEEIALLWHRPGLLEDPRLVEELVVAARLALENERLHAEAHAQLEDLRASRARVIATGDAERRRLERDLHDGAQQRLVGLSLALGLARSGLGTQADPAVLARFAEADAELRAALGDLRQVAHGIFPAVIADEGLAAALEALREEAPVAIELMALPKERFSAQVEAAGYFVVAETLRRGEPSTLTVSAKRHDALLVIEVGTQGAVDDLVAVEDRVGALDGSLEVVRELTGRITIRAEIPCES